MDEYKIPIVRVVLGLYQIQHDLSMIFQKYELMNESKTERINHKQTNK